MTLEWVLSVSLMGSVGFVAFFYFIIVSWHISYVSKWCHRLNNIIIMY